LINRENVLGGDLIVAEEREAIVAWAVQAMPPLLANNDFTLPASHQEAICQVATMNNSVRMAVRCRVRSAVAICVRIFAMASSISIRRRVSSGKSGAFAAAQAASVVLVMICLSALAMAGPPRVSARGGQGRQLLRFQGAVAGRADADCAGALTGCVAAGLGGVACAGAPGTM